MEKMKKVVVVVVVVLDDGCADAAAEGEQWSSISSSANMLASASRYGFANALSFI